MDSPVRIGVDVGGTFTDLLAQDTDGATAVRKVPSTPSNPAIGVVDALEALFDTTPIDPGEVESLFHGSTVTTNALLERTGAETGLLLTDGFDAVPVVGTQARPTAETINPFYSGREFLVPPRRTEGIPERVEHDGSVATALNEAAVREAVAEFESQGVESIAVCYLFSFLEPGHEERTREIILEEYPECHVSISSATAPRIREYKRLSTTAIDAYVAPSMEAYLRELDAELDALGVPNQQRFFMLSHGGLVPFETAAENGCRTLLSGPAAGVTAGAFVGEELGYSNLVTMDMGGTSCDVSIVADGDIPETTDSEPGGFPLSVPTVDIGAIGAGGGTLATVKDGRLRVGPESAGAEPGPVCYGQGGTDPTVTDANVVLGRLSRDSLLGGEIDVAAERAEAAIAECIGEPLGMSAVEAAAAILELVTDEMRTEIRLRLSRRGHDPREFTLFAYGGAGPTHASRLAGRLEVPRVIVPRRPGVNSAFGLLTTDIQGEHARSDLQLLMETSPAEIDRQFAELERAATETRRAEGFDPDAVDTERRLDLRYEGQGYEISVRLDGDDALQRDTIRDRFGRIHEQRYGHRGDEPLEIVTYRVASTVPVESRRAAVDGPDRSLARSPDPNLTRSVYDIDEGSFRETPVYDRTALAGSSLRGPAVVEQLDTTIMIEPGQHATFDNRGNATIEVTPDE
jgi:N-methylhydantoinase A